MNHLNWYDTDLHAQYTIIGIIVFLTVLLVTWGSVKLYKKMRKKDDRFSR